MGIWTMVMSSAAIPVVHAQTTGQSRAALTTGDAPLAVCEDARRVLIMVTTVRPDGSSVSCSVVLLTNVRAQTAGHCIDAVQGSTSSVCASFTTGTYTADAVYGVRKTR